MTDYKFGIDNEIKILPELEKYFGEPLKKTEDRYSFYDFHGENCYIEYKQRRCSVMTYPDTMVGLDKILEAQDNGIQDDFYCAFGFTDGVYIWKFNGDEYSVREGGRCDRGRSEFRQYVFVNTKYLIKICD